MITKWFKRFDTAIYKVLCGCMAFSWTIFEQVFSLVLFGEIPYPEPEEEK